MGGRVGSAGGGDGTGSNGFSGIGGGWVCGVTVDSDAIGGSGDRSTAEVVFGGVAARRTSAFAAVTRA